MRSLFIIACLVATTLAAQKSYNGYSVFHVSPTTQSQAGALNSWIDVEGIDFWDSPRNAGQTGRVMVAPSVLSKFQDFLTESGVNIQLIIDDVEKTLENERVAIAAKNAKLLASKAEGRGTLDFAHFWRYQEIYAYIDTLAAKNPELMSVETGGFTSEGRPIKVVKISTTGAQGDKPTIFIDVGIHAREWATYVTGVFLIHELVEHYDENRDIVDNVDWVIIPVANPDGYEYTQTNDRLWRKTRSVNNGSICLGIDGNRNFGYHWGGASQDPCAITFEGFAPHSAPEVKLITEILKEYQNVTSLYLAIHSFGNYLIFPWGYDYIYHDNHQNLQALGDTVAEAIASYRGTKYAVGNGAYLLYPASGASDDYAAGVANISYAYTVELPGGGLSGFDLEVEMIKPVVEETFLGFQAYARFLIEDSMN